MEDPQNHEETPAEDANKTVLEDQIIKLVVDGKISTLNQIIQSVMIQDYNSRNSRNHRKIKENPTFSWFKEYLDKETSEENIKKVVETCDQDNKSLLFYACYYNYQNLVLYLLKKGAKCFLESKQNQNLFHICCFYGHSECISYIWNFHLIKKKIKLYFKYRELVRQFKITKLEYSNLNQLRNNQKKLLNYSQFQIEILNLLQSFFTKLLQKFRQSICTLDQNGRNPIHYTAFRKFSKCLQCAEFFMNFSYDLKGFDQMNQLYKQLQVLEIDQENQFQLNKYTNILEKLFAILPPDSVRLLKDQFRQSVDQIKFETLNQLDKDSYPPLHISSQQGEYQLVQIFVQNGAVTSGQSQIERRNLIELASNDLVRKYLISLNEAAQENDQGVFSSLVNNGEYIDQKKAIDGLAPLHSAIQSQFVQQDLNLVQQCLDSEADINIQDSNGWTPLHFACQIGDQNLVQFLVTNQANLNKFSNKKQYPMHIAAQFNQAEIIRYLVSQGANIDVIFNFQSKGPRRLRSNFIIDCRQIRKYAKFKHLARTLSQFIRS